MRHKRSLAPEYFETMFRDTPDPWNFRTSFYEKEKYDHTIEALRGRRYQRGLEVGCANGVLTRRLAPQCENLLSIDVSPTALSLAKAFCADQLQVRFELMAFPAKAPLDERLDLIVMSEVVYYWDDRDLAHAAKVIAETCLENGDVVLVHWTGKTDYPKSGDAAVESLRHQLGDRFEQVVFDRREKYRLDLWRRI